MEVTLKPIRGDAFKVQAAPDDKISDLKKKIAEAKADFPADQLKLIYQGKILSDEVKLQDSGYISSGFIVVMVAKAAAKAAASAPAATPSPAEPPAQPAQVPAAPPVTSPDPEAQAAATVVTGAGSESVIAQLCDMGFERPQVERCLRAAFNNPDRAVEYLMSGIPEGLDVEMRGGAPPPAPAGTPGNPASAVQPQTGAQPFPSMAEGGAGGDSVEIPEALAQLRDHPQFRQLAGVIRQNPAVLQQMLPVLEQQYPELAQAINQHPAAFAQLLREEGRGGGGGGALGGSLPEAAALGQNPEMLEQLVQQLLPEIEQNDPAAAQAIRQNPQLLLQMVQAASAGEGQMPGAGGGAGQQVIHITEEENAAVERLVALGFDRETAAQAYFACDKNEELAASFLFEGGLS